MIISDLSSKRNQGGGESLVDLGCHEPLASVLGQSQEALDRDSIAVQLLQLDDLLLAVVPLAVLHAVLLKPLPGGQLLHFHIMALLHVLLKSRGDVG